MRHSAFTFLILWLVTTCSCQGRALTRGALVDIVISPEAAPSEKIAAGELSYYLGKLYQNTRFEVVYKEPRKAGHVIYLGCVESFPRLGEYLDNKELTRPESYIVTTSRIDGRKAGIIFGNDPAGAMYGVYNLLEKLGCGFYLSYDTFPSGLLKNFSFDGWELSDVPLVQDRIVFNWHNFLSGCSTWNLSDWKSWIIQAQKMGYNGVMVHAYGNNPMVKFSFNGQDKPVGYLSTTKKGRDWSTQHVNDVRRLWGGFVFENPVFGSEAAMVSDADRADAARRLMHDVFAHAEERDMDVYFAVDVDTASANPQNVIETLPQQARFPITVEQMRWMNQQESRIWLANPDTAEGYQYYKAQVKALLNAYPQIDCLVVWFRYGNTPWMAMKAEEMPESWQKEYRDELKRTPEAGKLWRSHNFFALGKVVMAFERALKETGRDDIQIAIGSWRFDFLPGCDRFLPRHVKFIPLDWEVLNDRSRLRNSESRQVIREAGAHRPVLPVVWAHHDDGNYVGRPYTPYSDFHSRLVDSRACGFGIIHWTTRPLDLYFKSLSRQVWQSSRNQPLRVACNEMAERLFGTGAGDKMAEYLYQWVTRGPKIGRETSEHFIDRKLGDMPGVLEGYKQRMKLLNEVDTSTLEPAEKNRLNYFKGLERFIIDVYRTEDALQQSRDLYRAGDIDAARNAMAECRPEAVIEHYGQFSSPGGISRGEQGLVASMNLRWLTHYIRHRQALGTEPVRYNFAPTSHDPLAQSMGTFTFHFDPDRKVWECFGTKETGAGTFEIPADVNIVRGSNIPAAYEEICRNGIESDKSITITLQPIMSKDGRGQTIPALLPQGQYRLHLLMLDPDSTARGQRVFDVSVQTQQNYEWYFFKPEKVKYLRLACHGNSENNWNSIHEVRTESLNRNTTQSVVTASDAIKDYPAQNTIDGKPETRWAAKGLKHWIQYCLNSNIETDRIGITWYQGNMRQPNFEILTSNDGREWTKVIPRAYKAVAIKTDRIDIFKQTERVNSILIRQYPVKLQSPGRIDITLKPIEGKAVLCGAILEPASEADGTESYKDSEVFSRENIISVMNRVNNYQVLHPWKLSDRNWIRATYYTGIMAFYKATKNSELLDQAISWAQKHKWQPGNEQAGGNILTCGQTYLQIYFLKKDPSMIAPLIQWINSGKPNTPSGRKVWYLEGGRRYADSLYVGPPTLAMLSRATNDKKYLNYMHAMHQDVTDLLFDKKHRLFYRDKRFIDAKSKNGKKVFWSRGNGWVIAGIPRILEYLPEDDPCYTKYVNLLRTMATSIARVQGKDGLWRANLGDPDEYPSPETSGTAFFTYAITWGINNGILEKDKYLPIAKKAWTGLVKSVHPDGKLGWVQPVGDRPRLVKSHMTHEYAVGAFLLAGSEILKLQE